MNMTYNVLFCIDVEARANIFSGHVISNPPKMHKLDAWKLRGKIIELPSWKHVSFWGVL
jgi:hypothetical protein